MGPAEARDAARRRFGSVAQVKDDCRESWGMRAIDTLRQDVRYAARSLAQVSRLHRGRPADARARHRREHGDLQRRARRAAAAAAVHARRSPRRGAAAGAADRRRQRRRVGQGNRRLPGADASLDAVVEYHQMSFNLLGRGEAVARADRRRVARVLRRPRRQADAGPHVPGGRRLAGRAGGAARSATRTGRTRSAATRRSSGARSR